MPSVGYWLELDVFKREVLDHRGYTVGQLTEGPVRAFSRFMTLFHAGLSLGILLKLFILF